MCSLIVYVIVANALVVVEAAGYSNKDNIGLEIAEKPIIRCYLNSDATDSESVNDCSVGSYEKTTKKPLSIRPSTSTPKVIVIPRGPFYDFVVNICQALLHKFSEDRIPGYFNTLSKCLDGLGSGWFMKMMLKRFSKRLKKYSVFSGKLLKFKVQYFLNIISSGKPMINEFFLAMNAIYSVRDDNKMDDFIYLLRQYGMGKTRHIRDKTRWTFERIIFDVFYKQKETIQTDINIKFQSALIEYLEEHKSAL